MGYRFVPFQTRPQTVWPEDIVSGTVYRVAVVRDGTQADDPVQ